MIVDVVRKDKFAITIKSNLDMNTYLNTNAVKAFSGKYIYDCCLFFDHDAYLAKNLEMLGMRVVNSSEAFLHCENKASMYQEMVAHGISIPRTFILPEQNTYTKQGIETFVEEAVVVLGLPIVVKRFYGESGEGVYLVKRKDDLYAVIEKFQGKDILLQEYIGESAGTDVRMLVIKGKVVAAVRRMSKDGGFRSNANFGANLTQYIPTVVETKLAVDATKAMGCDFAVVDMLKSVTGSLVCEVNTTANLYNFYKTTGVDIYEILFKECVMKKK